MEKSRSLERQNDLSTLSVENMSNLHRMKKQSMRVSGPKVRKYYSARVLINKNIIFLDFVMFGVFVNCYVLNMVPPTKFT